MHCIYTGRSLAADDFSLDHVLPWSFVGHDQLWNLVATHLPTNSAKGDRLPDLSVVEPLARIHAKAVATFRAAGYPGWSRIRELFILDGRFDPGLLETSESALCTELGKHYAQVFPTLWSLARQQGFEPLEHSLD
jgi:hypothetical protein